MIRSLIIALVLVSGAFAMSTFNVGYQGAGKEYVKKVRNERKSIRSGSGYYMPYVGGSRSFRGGK